LRRGWAETAHTTIVEMSVPDISPSPSAAGLDGNEDDGDDPNGMRPALCSADAKSAESARKVCGSGDPEFYLAPVVRSRLLAKNRPNETPAIHVGIANKGKIQSGIERKRRSLRSAKNKGSIQKMAPPTNSPETIKVNREVKTGRFRNRTVRSATLKPRPKTISSSGENTNRLNIAINIQPSNGEPYGYLDL